MNFLADGKKINAKHVSDAVEDFIPPTYPLEVELQSLVAVLECTNKALLPPQYREMSRQAIIERVESLKHMII